MICPTRVVAPDSLRIKDHRQWRNTGTRACAIAHQLAWRQAWRKGSEAALVFEDDVVLCSHFKSRLDLLTLPEDWVICYLGCVFKDPPLVVRTGLVQAGATWDMHAYIIRKSFAKMLGPVLRRFSRRRTAASAPEEGAAIDVIISNYCKTHAAYAVWPPMAWQSEGLSNIEHFYRGNYHPDPYPPHLPMTHAPFSSADPRKQIPFRKAQALPEASSRVVQNFVAFAQGTKRGLA